MFISVTGIILFHSLIICNSAVFNVFSVRLRHTNAANADVKDIKEGKEGKEGKEEVKKIRTRVVQCLWWARSATGNAPTRRTGTEVQGMTARSSAPFGSSRTCLTDCRCAKLKANPQTGLRLVMTWMTGVQWYPRLTLRLPVGPGKV